MTLLKEANKEALPLKVVQLDVYNDDLSAKNAIQEKYYLKSKGLTFL